MRRKSDEAGRPPPVEQDNAAARKTGRKGVLVFRLINAIIQTPGLLKPGGSACQRILSYQKIARIKVFGQAFFKKLACFIRQKAQEGQPKQSGGLFWRGEPPQGVPQCRLGGIQFVHITKHNDFIDRLRAASSKTMPPFFMHSFNNSANTEQYTGNDLFLRRFQ